MSSSIREASSSTGAASKLEEIFGRHELDLLLLQDDDIILAQVDATRARLWADKAASEGAGHASPGQEELQEQGSTRSCTKEKEELQEQGSTRSCTKEKEELQ